MGSRVHRGRAVQFSRGVAVCHMMLLTNALASGVLAASTTEECANLVPVEERRRGKGAFFSGCTSRSLTSSRGGCWSPLVEEESGCQTCIVQGSDDDKWTSSVFSKAFELDLDACPALVADIYGTLEGGIVSFEEVQSDHCGEDGWFAFEDSCYWKSSFLDVALNWEDADDRCAEMGARLVSLETEAENGFVINNLLWIGFLGEAYMGLRKTSADGDWRWKDSLIDFPPGEFNNSASFQDWEEGLDASSSYRSEGASCLEITPYSPKAWKPFSCKVYKQYVCEKAAERGEVDPLTDGGGNDDDNDDGGNGQNPGHQTPTRTAPPVVQTPSPTLILSPAPSTTTGMTLTSLFTEYPMGASIDSLSWAPTGSPTSAPTTAYYDMLHDKIDDDDVGLGEKGSCSERLGEYDALFMNKYDMDFYKDQSCLEDITTTSRSPPDWCNLFEIGQECRSCWLSCDGALRFLVDYSRLLPDSILFCPWVELGGFEESCDSINNRTTTNSSSSSSGNSTGDSTSDNTSGSTSGSTTNNIKNNSNNGDHNSRRSLLEMAGTFFQGWDRKKPPSLRTSLRQ